MFANCCEIDDNDDFIVLEEESKEELENETEFDPSKAVEIIEEEDDLTDELVLY